MIEKEPYTGPLSHTSLSDPLPTDWPAIGDNHPPLCDLILGVVGGARLEPNATGVWQPYKWAPILASGQTGIRSCYV